MYIYTHTHTCEPWHLQSLARAFVDFRATLSLCACTYSLAVVRRSTAVYRSDFSCRGPRAQTTGLLTTCPATKPPEREKGRELYRRGERDSRIDGFCFI